MKIPQQGNGMISGKQPSFRRIYSIGLVSTIVGIGVIILLNLATPLEYMHGQPSTPDQINGAVSGRQLSGIFNLAFLLLLNCPALILITRRLLRPLSDYFNLLRAGRESETLLERARRRLINLPFIMIPANLGLWILLPSALFLAAYGTGRLDSRTAAILAARAMMVGLISTGIMFLWIESYTRLRITPYLFPRGRLADVKGAARYSISRRIRLFYRIGTLMPMIILVLTLVTLQWQLDTLSISAMEYGSGILVFCLVLMFLRPF